jgi:lipopolysaccharide transport system ATP-binding protein
MRDHVWQIGLFGTFDVENYGDLLFPLIAEAELAERLGTVNLRRFSYHARTPPDWPYTVTSVTELPQLAASLDGVLIGGGFLIRFDKEVAPGYGPPTDGIHHPTGYWLTPALIALQHGLPLIWNAPGMHCNDLPAWADPLMELAFPHSSYIAVRDEPSQNALARFAPRDQIEVIPDTAFGISRLLRAEPSAEFKRLRETSGLTGPYIIIQAALGLEFFLRFIKEHAHRLQEYRFLALPVGPVLGDHAAILEAYELPGLVSLPVWPHPLLLAELISQAAAVVGHSYHLAITALATGVPVFTPVELSVGKYSALRNFETIYQLAKDTETEPDWFLSRLGKTNPSPAAQTARARLSQHWDRVAAALIAAPPTSQPAANRFWQSLPCLLEDAAIRYEDAAKRSEALSAEQQGRLDEFKLLLEQARAEITARDSLLEQSRAEIKARDELIATLYNSTTWKVTAPLRSVMHNLKRLVGYRSGR